MYKLYCRSSKVTDCHTMYINYVSRRDVQALLSIIESDGLPHNVYINYASKRVVQALLSIIESDGLPQNVYKLCVEKRCTSFTVGHRK